jgi:hypothetical protein
MKSKPKSFSFSKRMAGISAKGMTTLVIFWFALSIVLINPVSADPTTMDISGIWLTPFENGSYEIIQNDDQYTWTVRETGETGKGIIKGNKIISYIGDKKAVYDTMKFDSQGNPVVLSSKDEGYSSITLFKTCDDFKVFLNDSGADLTLMRIPEARCKE